MTTINPEMLGRVWLHSREEDTPTTSVYRPESYKFPPARGRLGFALNPKGELSELGPGPTDKMEKTPGRWELREDGTLALFRGDGTTPAKSLKILSVEPDRLVVAKA